MQWKKDLSTMQWELINLADIPNDREFRDAWVIGDKTVNIEVTRARDCIRNKLRELRTPIFQKLDEEFMRAVEDNDTASIATIKAKKQALRDLPQRTEILNANNIAELKEALQGIISQISV